MISERDFVLNNFYRDTYKQATSKETIDHIKDMYRLICENTSDINDDSFWMTGYERIRFSDIKLEECVYE